MMWGESDVRMLLCLDKINRGPSNWKNFGNGNTTTNPYYYGN